MDKGYMHVYTGDGKGKTTAAIGLCVRALGAGMSVYIGQFIKGMRYSEITTLETLAAALGPGRLVVELPIRAPVHDTLAREASAVELGLLPGVAQQQDQHGEA